jgi:hypothetical protein
MPSLHRNTVPKSTRFGLPGRPLRPVIAWFFRHRHKRLQSHFGGRAS